MMKDNIFCKKCLKINSFDDFDKYKFNELYTKLKTNKHLLQERVIIENMSFAGSGMKANGYIGTMDILENLKAWISNWV